MADRPITSTSLNDVRKLIDEKKIGEDVADAVGSLLGVVIAVAPIVGGPAALPLWGLIEPKNELIEAFKYAARKISRSKPSDYLDQAERMAAANCLLVYVSYFDGLRQFWPSIARRLGITEEEAKRALGSATEHAARGVPDDDVSVADRTVAIPHPADHGHRDASGREKIFDLLTGQVLMQLSTVARPKNRSDNGTLTNLHIELVRRAEELYQAGYLGMAVEFQQFFIWSVLRDQAAKGGQIQQLADDQRTWFELTNRAVYSLDIGLKEIAEAIARLPRPALTGTAQPNVEAVAEGLHRTYADVLQQQVIDDQFTVDDGPRLSFPRKIDGFIPQAYRIALYESREMHLEREHAWDEREVHTDIGAFILRYLESPYSIQTPLLILGHPGSGKSLLTEVLAGHLAYPAYTTVRVKLRDVNPDLSFLTQLETQIQDDTAGRVIAWADFADGLSLCPPIVILDGYDELLQATGKVFASYLDEVRQFQHQQAVQHRPVRVIVTSRLTLIDKAAVPLGTTVVKLEEFDQERRDAWRTVWNRVNAPYFQQAEIRPFAVPDNEKLLELARQPLLLLMLAIYDALGNDLSSQPDIDQPLLYDRLLRRFIERERSKGKEGREFAALSAGTRSAIIDSEMRRLGVAAIGMFNRQEVKIRREDLNADLRYFGAENAATAADGRALAEADLLLGSFFFIHESRSKLQDESPDHRDGSVAFEFLHNTFGEFLAADFILRRAVEEAWTICKLSGDAMLEAARSQRLAMLSEDWFGCLIHTALYTRPVILDMITEWSRHQLADGQWSRADMLAALDTIMSAQLRVALNDVTIPDPASKRRALSPYVPLSTRGHVAVYSLNLVLLRTYLGDEKYVLDETALESRVDACRPWDSLANLWRSWFTLDSLRVLANAITATRNDQRIVITPRRSSLSPGARSPLCDFFTVAVALGDNLTTATAGLQVAPLAGMPRRVFRDFWHSAGGAIPELNPTAELLALKMFAANGDELPNAPEGTQAADLRSPIQLNRAFEITVGFDDVVSRMTHTPRQWHRVTVNEDSFIDLAGLSRYQAEAAIEARVRLDPSWLSELVSGDSRLRWEDFLISPAAAPVLRAVAREFDRSQIVGALPRVGRQLQEGAISVRDVDTGSALAVVSYLANSTDLCAWALDTIIEKCTQGEWHLLDIPVETWEGLANLFRSPDEVIDMRKATFQVLLERAVEESIASVSGGEANDFHGVRALGPFWVQALRIGAVANAEWIIQAIHHSIPTIPSRIVGWQRKCIMSLIGWAREVDNPSLVLPVLRYAGDGVWLSRFLGDRQDRWNPEMVGSPSVASLLTHKEAMDLRWVLGFLQQAEQEAD